MANQIQADANTARQILEPEQFRADSLKLKKDCHAVLFAWASTDPNMSIKGYKSMKLSDLRAEIVKYLMTPHNKTF